MPTLWSEGGTIENKEWRPLNAGKRDTVSSDDELIVPLTV